MKKVLSFFALLLLSSVASAQVFQYYGPAAGIQKNTGSTYQNTSAVSADIANLWIGTGCGTSTNVPLLNGNCVTPGTSAAGPANAIQTTNGSGTFQGFTDFTWDETNTILSMGVGVSPIITTAPVTGALATPVLLQGGFASTSGTAGGDAEVIGGTSISGVGGNGQLRGGNGTGTGHGGGGVVIQGGAAANGPGGGISIVASNGSSGNNSGTISMSTASASGAGNSGAVSLTTGAVTGSGTSGGITIATGSSSTSTAGNLNLTAGGSTGGGTSGSVVITATHNTGTDGNIRLVSAGATTITSGAGIQVGAPTGGDCGVGCLNAQSLKINNVAVAAGGTPGGSNTQLQYNNSGAFGGTTMTYASASGDFSIPAPSSGTALSVASVGATTPAISTTVGGVGIGPCSAVASNSWLDVCEGTRGAGANFISLGDTTGTKADIGYATSNDDLYFYNLVSATTRLGTNNTDRVDISGTGNVTINAPSSGASLTVNNSTTSTGVAVTGNSSGNNAMTITAGSAASQSFGLAILAGTNGSDHGFQVLNQTGGTNYFEIFGDGGTTVGNAPTGGDKGVGTLNTAGTIYTNNVGLRMASISATCTSGGCSVHSSTTANGVSTTITRASVGSYSISFSPVFTALGGCSAVTLDTTVAPIGNTPFISLSSVSNSGVSIATSQNGTLTDLNWSVVCNGT